MKKDAGSGLSSMGVLHPKGIPPPPPDRARVPVRVIEMPGDKHAGEYANDPVPGFSGTVLDVSIAFLRSEL